MENSYHKFTKDTLIIGIANILIALSGLLRLPILTKTLGVYDYGLWAQAQITISLALGIVGLGLPYASSRFLPAKTQKEDIREEFWSVFFVVLFATIFAFFILMLIANPIAKAFFNGSVEIVRLTSLIILVWSLNTVLLSIFRAFRLMKKYAAFVVGNNYLELALIAFLVLQGYGIINIMWAMFLVRCFTFFLLFYLINSKIRFKRPNFSNIREYLSFGLPTIPGNFASWVISASDRYVISYYLGTASVGIYSAAYSVGSVLAMLAGIFGFVLPPTLSKLYDDGKLIEVKTHLSYSLKYLLSINIPFVFGAAVLAKPVLKLFSTAEIASQGSLVVPLVAFSILPYSSYVIISHTLVLSKKTKILAFIWSAAAIINLGLNIMIVPYFGITGAAFTTLIAYLCALITGIHYSIKELKFSIDWIFIFKSLLASIIMSIVIWRIDPQTNISTIMVVLLGALVYVSILFLSKGFKKTEIDFFQTIVRQKLNDPLK